MEITIPYKPRVQFKAFHDRKERFACLVMHRRAGKTVAAVNDLQREILTCPKPKARGAYIAPLYKQAKSVAWDYLKEIATVIPGVKVNESELRVDYPNGARVQLFGADNYDALRGMYFDYAVLDEPADFPVNAWPTVIRPTLSDRKGKATFIGTPKGKNEFWDIYKQALENDKWFTDVLKASESGILDAEELEEALRIMGQDRYDQEFECSFEAAIQGAYYGTEIGNAQAAGRIGDVHYDPALPVVTSWDLGIGDSTAIWFAQYTGTERRFIDYYESSGVGLDHYVAMLNARGYIYDQHILPHDVRVKELGSGKSRLEILESLGVRDVTIAPQLRLDDGIQAARLFLATCWFDETKCDRGLEALRQYRRDFDERGKTWRGRPLHDWTSHAADSFRYMATGYRGAAEWGSGPIRRNLKGLA